MYMYQEVQYYFLVKDGAGEALRNTKQRSSKTLQTTSVRQSNANSTLKPPLTFNEVEKTKHENFDFVCFFFVHFARHNSKSIRCMRVLKCPTTVLLTYYIPICFEFRVSYEWRVMPNNFPKAPSRACAYTLIGFSRNNRVDGQLNAFLVCQELTVYNLVRRSWFIVFSINLVYLKAVQSSKERYCVQNFWVQRIGR